MADERDDRARRLPRLGAPRNLRRSTGLRGPTSVLTAAATIVGLLGALDTPATATANTATGVASAGVSQSDARDALTVLGSMTLRQKVGQLFMVGTPATSVDAATRSHITNRHVGNVMLTGRSYGGIRTPARVSAAMQQRTTASATRNVRLFVATDQEGGQVQVLNGPGFSDMPSALRQGRWTPNHLRTEASRWARQLRAAGVNMNLAPVADTVPSPRAASNNPPIGAHDRQFGYSAQVVASHSRAFMAAMDANGVAPTIKHFPGLGRVSANTDTSRRVADRVTRRGDPYLRPFAASIEAGSPFVMMSTAYYTRLDPENPAAFSPFIINRVLREDLDYDGVVISDDLANAGAVAAWSTAQRAVKFVGAGGNMVLIVDPAPLPAMYRAVLERAARDPAFRAKVNGSALKVLQSKQARGLL